MAELIFSREAGEEIPQFITDEKAQPIGSADEQVAEAMRIAKDANAKLEAEESIVRYIEKMDAMTVPQAIDFLDAQSQFIREKYLRAEKLSKNRRSILASYGW